MNLRLAREGEEATTVREFVDLAASATRTHSGDLILEIGRWVELVRHDDFDIESHIGDYSARFGSSEEETRVRLEGFRQVTGVLPTRFVELAASAGVRTLNAVLELRVVADPDALPPDSPISAA